MNKKIKSQLKVERLEAIAHYSDMMLDTWHSVAENIVKKEIGLRIFYTMHKAGKAFVQEFVASYPQTKEIFEAYERDHLPEYKWAILSRPMKKYETIVSFSVEDGAIRNASLIFDGKLYMSDVLPHIKAHFPKYNFIAIAHAVVK